MSVSLSPQVIEILPVLQSLPTAEKMQIIHLLSNGTTETVSKQEIKDKLTVAEFSAIMKKRNLAKGKSLTVEEMNESIAKIFTEQNN